MKLLKLNRPVERQERKRVEIYLVMGIMALAYYSVQKFVRFGDSTAGMVDQSIWLLILLSMISLLMVVGISGWLLNRFLFNMGMPAVGNLVLQFKQMEIWQQLGFYWLSFALLVLAGVGALSAVL
ncbi:hypothetical protein ACVWYN_000040 [Pedobacter sp. UYP24]